MRLYLLFILLTISWISVSAQKNLPPAYEIKTDTLLEQDLSKNFWQMLPDKSGNLTINEVSSNLFDNKFYNRSLAPASNDTNTNTYWFRYILKNETGHDIDIALDSRADTSDFYVSEEGNKWKHFITGDFVQWSKKDGIKDVNYVPITILAGETKQVYYRAYYPIKGIDALFTVDFENTNQLIKQRLDEYETGYIPDSDYLLIFFAGFNFLAAIFNLVLFRIIREKTYLFFSLFLFSSCFNNNPLATEILRREHLMLSVFLTALSALVLFFFIWFMRYYFKTSQLFPRLNKVLFIAGLISLVGSLVTTAYDCITLSIGASTVTLIISRFLHTLSFIVIVCSVIYLSFKLHDEHSKLFFLL